jgi:hypothetical protein
MRRSHGNATHRERRPQCRRHRAGRAGSADPESRRTPEARSGRSVWRLRDLVEQHLRGHEDIIVTDRK